MEKGDITWEVINLPSKDSKLWQSGYRGGIEIGSKVIYLLQHREFNEDGSIKRMAPPRFIVFHKSELSSTRVPKSREKGSPMSRVEFEDLLDFLLGGDMRNEICNLIYDQILKDTERELGKTSKKRKK
ncbi:MAG: hypothetical protein ACW98U_06105 [Candidatus Thorarchaeota archaeon]|jgi:hypothetical protein